MIIIPSNVMAAPSDPFFSNTVLLLKTVDISGATNSTFRDDSTNNFVPTRNGDVTQGALSPYVPSGYWSNYFDGNGDSLSMPSNAALAPGTGSFTIEAWINPANWTNIASGVFIVAVNGGLWFGKNGGNFVVRAYAVADQLQHATLPTVGQWTHVVAVRSGTTLSLYFNGTRVATTTNSHSFPQGTGWIGNDDSNSSAFAGHISNFRLVKGVAVYDPTQTTITVPTEPLTAATGTSVLALQDNRFIDRSSNNFALTRNGDVSVQRFAPFPVANTVTTHLASTGSVYFDGTGDYLTCPTGYLTSIGTGNFTVEGWWNFQDFTIRTSYFQRLWSFGSGLANDVTLNVRDTGFLNYRNNDGVLIAADAVMNLNTWNHVALVRNSGTTTLYLNGVSVGTTATNNNLTSPASSPFYVGAEAGGAGGYFCGHASNIRVTNTAAYTSNFTPPTSPVTAISGTSLLTCQNSSTVTDASTNNFTITRVGDAKASEVSPFKRSSSVYGGSGYFDGSGDYLSIPNNAAFSFGAPSGNANDFTVEFWTFPTTTTVTAPVHTTYTGNSYWGFAFNKDDGNANVVGMTNFFLTDSFRVQSASGALRANEWSHIAATRSGTTVRLFINGTQVASGTSSINPAPTGALQFGRDTVLARDYAGYIANARIVKGTAVYTANFTPPTSPVTAISGTSLLLNFDNAGAIDATGSANYAINGTARTSKTLTRYTDTSIEHPDKNALANTAAVGGPLPIFALPGDFTIEFNYNPQGGYGDSVLYDHGPTNALLSVFTFANGALGLIAGGGTVVITGTTVLSPSTWYHIAVTRSGTSVRLFLNGVQQGATWTNSTSFAATQPRLGSYYNGTYSTPGYYSELRVTRAARYTSNFTPPTAELPTR